MNQSMQKLTNILLVEDSAADIMLIKEAFKECELELNLNTVMDGEEAIKYLLKKEKYTTAVEPDLIFLDLNLPKVNGQEVLRQIKTNPSLKHIPVIVLTSSQNAEDINLAYSMQANCYIQKPIDLEEFIQAIKTAINFWFITVATPNH